MNIYKNNEETGNTPTWRLSNEEIYRTIKYNVEQQVREMLSSYYYDWSKRTTYDEDICINNFSWGILDCLNKNYPEEFHHEMAEGVPTREEEIMYCVAFPRYVKIWNENWQKMVIESGMSKEVYQNKKHEAILRIKYKDRASYLLTHN